MASRQLRKLRKQQELLNLQKDASEASDGGDEPESPVRPRTSVFSAFAALNDVGDGDGDEDEKSEGEETQPESAHAGKPIEETAPLKKGKKPKKKKKKKGKKTEAAPLDDIDQALKELKLAETRKPSSSAAKSSDNPLHDLFQINFQYLRVMNEMRKLFGKAIDAADSETAQEGIQLTGSNVSLETYLSASAAPGGQTSKSGMFESVLRTNPFIEGKKTWPRDSALGLKMAHVADDGLVSEYTFCHDKQYNVLESQFFDLVQMYDPLLIIKYLYKHPYHVSSLIQISKFAKYNDQNSALAADLIERALFTFGRVSLKEFRRKLEQGRVFMDFARPENRQFFLAGWHLIQHLVLKGTFRTALEWSKVFLGINHEDPYAIMNWIHVLAIRAYQAQWFVDLCGTRLLDEAHGLETSAYIKQTLGLAYLQLGDVALAKAALITGIERLPWLYCSLFSALGLDTPRSIWGVQPRNDDEELHTKLYIHMTKDLWNTPQTIELLTESANAAQKVTPNSLPPGPRVSLGTARFIYLDGNADLMSAVPRNMLHSSPNFDFDPLPPAKRKNIFSSSAQQLQWSATTPARLARGPLPPFMRDPRVQAAGMGAGIDPNAAPWTEEEQQLARELELAELEAETGGHVDARGFLGRVLDLMRPPNPAGGVDAGDASDDDADARQLPGLDDRGLPLDWREALAYLQEEAQLDIPGGWGGWGDDSWDDDEFEGEDDFEGRLGEDDDDDLPDLEPIRVPRQATVEDAEDDDSDGDQQEGPRPR